MVFPTLWRTSSPSLWDDAFTARREFDRMLDRVLATPYLPTGAAAVWSPVVDVREDKDEIRVHAELPGLKPEDVEVSVENGVLTIAGEKKHETEEGHEDGDYHLVERRYGRFERSFQVPTSVDANAVSARFENGVLMVRLPKSEAAKPRRVQVEVGKGATKQVESKSSK